MVSLAIRHALDALKDPNDARKDSSDVDLYSFAEGASNDVLGLEVRRWVLAETKIEPDATPRFRLKHAIRQDLDPQLVGRTEELYPRLSEKLHKALQKRGPDAKSKNDPGMFENAGEGRIPTCPDIVVIDDLDSVFRQVQISKSLSYDSNDPFKKSENAQSYNRDSYEIALNILAERMHDAARQLRFEP